MLKQSLCLVKKSTILYTDVMSIKIYAKTWFLLQRELSFKFSENGKAKARGSKCK